MFCKQNNNFNKDRIGNIPKDAFWMGGLDGGQWYLVENINVNKKTVYFKIYNDYNGNLMVGKYFKLYCEKLNGNELNLDNIKKYINGFDGTKIILTIIDKNQKYCYFE